MTSQGIAKGTFQILSLENGRVVWQSPVMENAILNSFWSTLIQHINGVTTSPLGVTTIEGGSGSTPVSLTDTALATMLFDGIPPAKSIPAAKSIQFEFFVVDAEMPNGTYREIGLRAGATLITRALFSTPYVKASGRDTIIRYTLSFDSV